MLDLAIFTCRQVPDLHRQDAHVARVLESMGIKVTPVVWNTRVDLCAFDAGLVRSIWDYHEHYPEYLEWIAVLASQNMLMLNETQALKWNAHKSYLLQLEASGVDIIPTKYVQQPEAHRIVEIAEKNHWEEYIVKPAVGASSHLLYKVKGGHDLSEIPFDKYVHGCLVQPFLPELPNQGEWSLIFLENRFSHAAIKTATPGEYRVQAEFGGSLVIADPPEHVVAAARRALQNTPLSTLLYARVDGVIMQEHFLISEIELIEPQLFLESDQLVERFARTIANRLLKQD